MRGKLKGACERNLCVQMRATQRGKTFIFPCLSSTGHRYAYDKHNYQLRLSFLTQFHNLPFAVGGTVSPPWITLGMLTLPASTFFHRSALKKTYPSSATKSRKPLTCSASCHWPPLSRAVIREQHVTASHSMPALLMWLNTSMAVNA